MLAHSLLNELFNVFPVLFNIKRVRRGYDQLPKTQKSDYITNKDVGASFDYFQKCTSYYKYYGK